MKFEVKVKPNSKKNEIQRNDDGTLTVRVTASPIEGKANEKVIDLLSEYLHRPKRSISIIAGAKRKTKLIEVE